MPAASQKGVPIALLPALTTTGTGTAVVLPITAGMPRIHLRGVATITAGTIVLEEALDPAYAGTWSQLQSILGTTLNGAEQVIHILGTVGAIRLRITTNIAGGTISADLVSN